MTREEWLNEFVEEVRPDFDHVMATLPAKIRASCGWPHKNGVSRKRRRIGECWSAEVSKDQAFEVFISPVLSTEIEVGETVIHELIHTVVPDAGHKAPFKRIMRAIGLEGKPTATVAGEALRGRIREVADRIGPYPHGEITYRGNESKQSTRLLKVACPECGCVVRMTQKWIDDVGIPTCGCGSLMETAKSTT